MIQITCKGNSAICTRTERLTSGMVGLQCEFVFDSAWDGLARTAVFVAGSEQRDVLLTGDTCAVPWEVLKTAGYQLVIGVYGTNAEGTLVIPTVYAMCGGIASGADPSGNESTDPTLPVWGQMQGMIGDLADLATASKDNLVAAINEAAQSGGGGGSAVELDTTLTQSGKAADAKAVGDALAGKQPKGDYLTQNELPDMTAYRTAEAQDAIDAGKQDTLIQSGATVGQIAKITAVDSSGKPTAWGAVDMPISFKPAGRFYLTFSSPNSFTLAVNDATKHWDGTLEYFASDKTWTVWDGTTTLSSVDNDGEHVLYLRGTGNTKIGYYDYVDTEDYIPWVINGTDVRCNGNIETLLDYATVEAGQNPTMATECFIGLFKDCIALSQAPDLPATTLADYCYGSMFDGCTALTQAPALPAMTLVNNCYSSMFSGCTSLTQAPELPATTLANNCYSYMFDGCTSLIQAPALPATTLANWCYRRMFYGCISLKLSSTQTGEYTQEYRIPSSGDGVAATDALADMFTSTGGTFTGTPAINTTYYLSSDNMIVRETEIDTLNGYVGSMIDVAIAEHTSNPLNITGATVGQIAKITAVDDTGKPTAWEAVDMPSGGGGASYRSWSKVWTLAVAEDIAGFTASGIDLDGKSEIMIVFISDSTASRNMTNGRLSINGVDAGKALFNTLPLKKDSHSFVIIGRADVGIEYTTMQATAEYQTYPWQGEVKIVHRMVSGTGSIIQWTAGSTIEITQASATLGQGITIEIYVR